MKLILALFLCILARPSASVCVRNVNGEIITYDNLESWDIVENCETCTCFDNVILCTDIAGCTPTTPPMISDTTETSESSTESSSESTESSSESTESSLD